MDKRHEFPASYHGHVLDYAEARNLCSIVAREVQVDLSNPDREKGIVRRRILNCAKTIVATFGFPQRIMCRFLIQSMQGVSARTIFDALPARMKDSKKAAN